MRLLEHFIPLPTLTFNMVSRLSEFLRPVPNASTPNWFTFSRSGAFHPACQPIVMDHRKGHWNVRLVFREVLLYQVAFGLMISQVRRAGPRAPFWSSVLTDRAPSGIQDP